MARITKTFVRETMKNNPALFYEPMPDAWKELFPGKVSARVRETVTFRVQVRKMQIRQVSKKVDISEDPGIV